MKKKTDYNVRRQLLDELYGESTMVLETAYSYAKNYVLYGIDITKAWITAAQQASNVERVKLDAWAKAYDSFKKDYENRLKADIVAMLGKIRTEIDKAYEELDGYDPDALGTFACRIEDILDKHKAESEVKE